MLKFEAWITLEISRNDVEDACSNNAILAHR